jgi:4-hydroxyphenylacetate 3-monooxygenase
MFKPLVDVRARIYDMARDPPKRRRWPIRMTTGELCSIGTKLPYTQDDWHARRAAVDAVLDDDGGIGTRVGDETVGEMWSLSDGQNVLNEANPRFSENIRRHVERVVREDPFHVSAGLSDRVQPGAKRA